MSTEQLEALLAAGEVEGEEELAEEEPSEGAEETTDEETPDDDTPEEDSEEEEVQTVDLDVEVLASALGLEPDDLVVDDDGKVSVRAKVNGEELKTSLADLRKSYQLQKNLDDKAHRLNMEREQFQAYAQQAAQRFEQEVSVADSMIEKQAEKLAEQFQAIDWDRLRSSDPAEWAARRQEFTNAYNGLKTQKADLQEAYANRQREMQAQYQQASEAHLRKEAELLAGKLPEWRDQKVATQEQQELASYLMEQGYSGPELNIADHRAILLARKAMLYDKQAKAAPVSKKVRKVGRVMSSGSQQNGVQKARKQQREKMTRLKKTGSDRDAIDLLLDMVD